MVTDDQILSFYKMPIDIKKIVKIQYFASKILETLNDHYKN